MNTSPAADFGHREADRPRSRLDCRNDVLLVHAQDDISIIATFQEQSCYEQPVSALAKLQYMSDGLASDRKLMQDLVRWTKLAPSRLAKEADLTPTTILRAYNGTATTRISVPTLEKLKAKFPDFPGFSEAPTVSSSPLPKELRLPVRYEVAAGGFLLRDDLPQRPYGWRTVAAIAPYQTNTQWLERVVSDSMDRLIPEGSTIHVVDAREIQFRPTHGAIVVVERTSAQGSLVERTVKQIEMTGDGAQLWPRSHNPRWNRPVLLSDGVRDGEDASAEIVGLVLRSYMFFTADDAEAFEPDAPFEDPA